MYSILYFLRNEVWPYRICIVSDTHIVSMHHRQRLSIRNKARLLEGYWKKKMNLSLPLQCLGTKF